MTVAAVSRADDSAPCDISTGVIRGTCLASGLLDASAQQALTLSSGATIVVQGSSLEIRAGTLRVEKPALITSVVDRAAKGSDGLDHGKPWTSSGRNAHEDWLASGQSQADIGPTGLAGAKGLVGPSVTLHATKITDLETLQERLVVDLRGGEGGRGGNGGAGRTLICGEHGEEQKSGPRGPSGENGKAGRNGQITIIQRGLSPEKAKEAKEALEDTSPKPRQYALTISGGISMGVYEAGFNWALLRMMRAKRLDLLGITGASAGSINTVLSAIAWCDEDFESSTATGNLFYETWVDVGLDELMPSLDSDYADDDGLLTRTAFNDAIKKIGQRVGQLEGGGVSRIKLRKNCVMPIGMTVTSFEPVMLNVNQSATPVNRFTIVLTAEEVGGTLRFFDTNREDEFPIAGMYIHFMSDRQDEVAWKNVVSALKASSAFPVAFGPQKLEYYRLHESASNPLKQSGYFIDGGVFDNVPVGLAYGLLVDPPKRTPGPATRGDLRIVALVPGQRQFERSAAEQGDPPPVRGIAEVGPVARDFIGIGRRYEAQSFDRYLPELTKLGVGKYPHFTGATSTRSHPIFGERVGAFGGFLLKSFRHFDFAIGIYDGALFEIDQECGVKSQITSKGLACIATEAFRRHEQLRLDADKTGLSHLYRELLRQEFIDRTGSQDRAAANLRDILLPNGISALAWIDSATPRQPMHELMEQSTAVRECERAGNTKGPGLWATLDEIIALQGVTLPAFLAQDAGIIADPDTWLESSGGRALRRLRILSIHNQQIGNSRLAFGAEYGLRSALSVARKGLDLDPSTIPNERRKFWTMALHGFPHVAAFSRFDAHLGWRPGYAPFRTIGFTAPLAFSVPYLGRDGEPAGHVAAAVSVRNPYRALHWSVTTVEGGPRLSRSFQHRDDIDLGWEVSSYVMYDKFKLGIAKDRWDSRDPVVFSFGVADLNGLAYWLFQMPVWYRNKFTAPKAIEY